MLHRSVVVTTVAGMLGGKMWWLAALVAVSACSKTSTKTQVICEGDETASCRGDNGCPGERHCISGSWSACECSGDEGAGGSATSAAAGTANSNTGTAAGSVGGAGGESGSVSTQGSTSNGGSGGSSQNTTSTGSTDAADASSGGATSGSTTDTSTSGTLPETSVLGTVISHRREPLVGVSVMLGDEIQQTDESGNFQFDDVPDTYDVMLNFTLQDLSEPSGSNDQRQGWVYQGLTRRDPTLQVYGSPQVRSAAVSYVPSNLTTTTNRVIGVAIGNEFSGTWSHIDAAGLDSSVGFYQPALVNMRAHALVWEGTSELPISYHAYGASGVIAIDSGRDASDPIPIEFDLPDASISSGTVSGTVQSPSNNARQNWAFLRFSTGAVMALLKDNNVGSQAAYSYTLPSVPSATLNIAAQEGNLDDGAKSFAFRGPLSPGASDVDLSIPSPATLTSPALDGELTQATLFSFSSDFSSNIWLFRNDSDAATLFVVTNEAELSIPVFPDGFDILTPNTSFSWRVETHGEYESVDEMAGPAGYCGDFNYYQLAGGGPEKSDGSYTQSSRGRVSTP